MKRLLLIIDPQRDFTQQQGTLYVPQAEQAMAYLSQFITDNQEQLTDICLSLDSHHPYHIGHAIYWANAQGEHPQPFTKIIDTKVWKPTQTPLSQIDTYLKALNKQGRVHTIWPEHCILDTQGWEIDPELSSALSQWEQWRKKKGLSSYKTYQKGSFPDAEMFSILSTFDKKLIDMDNLPINFDDYDQIFIAGVAEDICVAETITDLIRIPSLENKLIFLQQGMAGLDKEAKSLHIFKEAVENFGAQYR